MREVSRDQDAARFPRLAAAAEAHGGNARSAPSSRGLSEGREPASPSATMETVGTGLTSSSGGLGGSRSEYACASPSGGPEDAALHQRIERPLHPVPTT